MYQVTVEEAQKSFFLLTISIYCYFLSYADNRKNITGSVPIYPIESRRKFVSFFCVMGVKSATKYLREETI